MVVVYMATAFLASYISTGQSDINGCGLHGYGLVLLHIFQQVNPI